MASTTIMWFRRDLRLTDNPALVAASSDAGPGGAVVAFFCIDPQLYGLAGSPRRAFLLRCLRSLDASIDGRLVVRTGAPASVVPALAQEVDATSVFATADFGPYGTRRDDAVATALRRGGVRFDPVGSSYAVPPGTLRSGHGSPFKVFTPFERAWRNHGWSSPVAVPDVAFSARLPGAVMPDEASSDLQLPAAGEGAAMRAFRRFCDRHLARYAHDRNLPGLDATSRLSPHLKFGTIHPRQLLAELGPAKPHATFVKELCWREFYADVLYHRPDSARRNLQERMASLEVDVGPVADELFTAWAQGRTGYPFVDAGMRQLLTEAWMHNRARMVAASFLVKDLHLDWRRGAAHFMAHLVDGDLASNQHGWQWCAGTGTDPAPFFRIFNPTVQGERFDPDGHYVRHWIPELATLPARYVHSPWDAPNGPPAGYPHPIVDHRVEREEALRRYGALSGERT